AVLLDEIGHRVVHAGQFRAGNAGRAGLFRAAAIEHRITAGEQHVHAHIDADIDAAMEGHALALHLLDAAVDMVLLDLEVGNAVAHQPARAALALEHMHLVPGPAELLRGRHAGRPRTDDRDPPAGLLLRRLRAHITRFIGLVG